MFDYKTRPRHSMYVCVSFCVSCVCVCVRACVRVRVCVRVRMRVPVRCVYIHTVQTAPKYTNFCAYAYAYFFVSSPTNKYCAYKFLILAYDK